MSVYQYPIPKRRAAGLKDLPYTQPQAPSEGVTPKPSYEVNVMWALQQAGWKADQIGYQVPIYGGRSIRGGLVVDFVLYTPAPIPIQVGASWWHRDSAAELIEDAQIQQYFGRLPLKFFDTMVDTKEKALETVLREIGRA